MSEATRQDAEMHAWLHPVQGRVPAAQWRFLLGVSEITALQLALHCALRGDCESLTRLCDEIEHTGRVLDVMDATDLVFTEKLPAPITDESGKGHELLPASIESRGFEDIVALCLSRPVVGEQVTQPFEALQAMGSMREGACLVPQQQAFHPRQRALLRRAIDVVRLADGLHDSAHLKRLITSVVSRVGFNGILDELAACGVDIDSMVHLPVERVSDRTTEPKFHSLYSHALRQGNPVAALSLVRRALSLVRDEPVAQFVFDHAALLEALLGNDTEREIGLVTSAEVLRREVGDKALEGDERFQALIALCGHAARRCPDEVVQGCLTIVDAYLTSFQNGKRRFDKLPPCGPFVRGVMRPLAEMAPEQLSAAFYRVTGRDKGHTIQIISHALSCCCVEAMEALLPVLGEVLNNTVQQVPGIHGWMALADCGYWLPAHSLLQWRRCLEMLRAAGLEPTGVIPLQVYDKDRQCMCPVDTTLLHLLPVFSKDAMGRRRDGVLERMLMLAQMGADVMALDGAGRTPLDCFENEELAQQWRELALSHHAGVVARQALGLSFQAP